MEDMKPDSLKIPASLLKGLQEMAGGDVGPDKQTLYGIAVTMLVLADDDARAQAAADYAKLLSLAVSRNSTVMVQALKLRTERAAAAAVEQATEEETSRAASGAKPGGPPLRQTRRSA